MKGGGGKRGRGMRERERERMHKIMKGIDLWGVK